MAETHDENQEAKDLATAQLAMEALQNTDILNMLTSDEQLGLLNSILQGTSHTDVEKFPIEAFMEYAEYNIVGAPELTELITFENAHLIAQHLSTSSDTEAATALLNELLYWHKNGRI